ncbi:helix-turn-helix domain-containing protein [Actinomadura logoneensis]|uniref:helix-turn-helix domain-containing protein n=1 Tax=Actinomadura logoneensis TaxID=2293572 RepID=UPI0013146A3E|nr:helix-turn-helix transcriptional regulator [Actinomadura logoneensis]
MISPYVRRLRLAQELRDRRQAAGLTSEELARRAGTHRQMISKLENGHIPPHQDEVLALLDALGVDGDEWTELVTLANEAASRGWWEGMAKQMGERQALVANLEAGAETIRHYQHAIIPGLLQTPEYTRFQAAADDGRSMAAGTTVEGILRGRATRQRMLRRPGGGPVYEVIIDELVMRRLSVPRETMRDQLAAITELCDAEERITVRVLPIDARFEDHIVPTSSFVVYTYANGDPTVVSIEGVTQDAALTGEKSTGPYVRMFDRLRDSALSIEGSRDYLDKAVEVLRA